MIEFALTILGLISAYKLGKWVEQQSRHEPKARPRRLWLPWSARNR